MNDVFSSYSGCKNQVDKKIFLANTIKIGFERYQGLFTLERALKRIQDIPLRWKEICEITNRDDSR
jgi:hypothetical protein